MSKLQSASAAVTLPPNDAACPSALHLSSLLATASTFDDLAALGAKVFDAPIVLISSIEENRQGFKAAFGVDAREAGRHLSMCAPALLGAQPLLALDTQHDSRFRNDALFTVEPPVRFCAGAAVLGRGGQNLGTFCVMDKQPRREFTAAQQSELLRFAALTACLIEQRGLEREVREANDRFLLATRASAGGMWDLDLLTRELHFSAHWNKILGLPAADSVGKLEDWIDRIHPFDYERVKTSWYDLRRNAEPSLELEFRCRHEDGTWRLLTTRVFCQRDAAGSLVKVAGSCTDGTSAKMVDPLTGLHNRSSLVERLQWRIDRQGDHKRSYGLLFVDLDGFKRVNDSLGHRCGDLLLAEVARRLENAVYEAPGSLVARLGGDEFVLLIDEAEAAEDVLTVASMLEYLLAAPVNCDGQQVFTSASVGVVFGGGTDYTRAEQVLEDADVAMYRAKMHGKAQNAVFSDKMREESRAKLQMGSDLRTALKNGELEVWYQPKVRLPSGGIIGFEALLRWRHPLRGLLPAAEFIPLAEELGLIGEIGRWVASQAVTQLANWRKRGLVDMQATMAVNVSSRQFREADLLLFFKALLRAAGLPPACFIVEVTENVLVEDSAALLTLLESIVAAGIGLDLDDFGTGYSSLSNLHRFPIRSVKIDRSFISRMTTNPESVTMVASILVLTNSLKLRVIAEGVETEAQAEHLSRLGCTAAQGFLFSPARPAEELDRYLRERAGVPRLQRRAEVFPRPMPVAVPAQVRPFAASAQIKASAVPPQLASVAGYGRPRLLRFA